MDHADDVGVRPGEDPVEAGEGRHGGGDEGRLGPLGGAPRVRRMHCNALMTFWPGNRQKSEKTRQGYEVNKRRGEIKESSSMRFLFGGKAGEILCEEGEARVRETGSKMRARNDTCLSNDYVLAPFKIFLA